MKKYLFGCILCLIISTAYAQRIIVHDLDEEGQVVSDRSFSVDDMIVLAHRKAADKPIHYFQGKITGIFKSRNVIRVFDYARSTRVVAIAGKKIDLDEIVGIEKMDESKFKSREKKAVGAAIASSIGAGIGGTYGHALEYGSDAASIGFDFTTRERVGEQQITIEFSDY